MSPSPPAPPRPLRGAGGEAKFRGSAAPLEVSPPELGAEPGAPPVSCPSPPPPPSPDPPDRGVALLSATPPPRRASPAAPGTPAAGPRVLLGPRSEGCPGFASPRPVPGRGFRGAARQGLAGIPVLRAGSPLAAWLSRRPREEPGSPPSSPPCSDKAEPGGRWGPGGGVRAGGGPIFPLPSPAQPSLPAARGSWAGQGRGQGARPKPGSSRRSAGHGCRPVAGGRVPAGVAPLSPRLPRPWAWRRRAVGAAGTVFVWNMDEAPFIKLEFWEMTHGLASYTS